MVFLGILFFAHDGFGESNGKTATHGRDAMPCVCDPTNKPLAIFIKNYGVNQRAYDDGLRNESQNHG